SPLRCPERVLWNMVSRRGMPAAETIGADTIDVENPEAKEGSEADRAPLRDGAGAKGNCIWRCCRFISFLDVVVLGFAGTACVAGIVSCWYIHNFAALALRGCSLALCVLLCIEQGTRNTTCTCKCLRQLFPALEYWVGRGLVHLFIGLQMEGTNSEGMDTATRDLTNVASMAVSAMGIFFIAGAFMCFGPLERRGQRLAVRKEEVMRELSELERKRKALESEAGL
ncbi:unnamed protein product, partial [Cladocopium goreaui]